MESRMVPNGFLSEMEELRNLFPKSRLLIACESCFHLKPSVIVELGTVTTCSWCSKLTDGLLLLQSNTEDGIQYFVVRKCTARIGQPVKECRNNLGLRWKTCPKGEECRYAHSKIELLVWDFERKSKLQKKDFIKKFNGEEMNEQPTLKVIFHCVVCSQNFDNGEEFSQHRDTSMHKILMRKTEDGGKLRWKHRPLPDTESVLELCESNGDDCPEKLACPLAHSKEELDEWSRRLQLREEKLKFANEAGLMSFADSVLHEYEKSDSVASVLRENLDGIRVITDYQTRQKLPRKRKKFAWNLRIRCKNHKLQLNHAVFISPNGGKNQFKICRCRKKRLSRAVEHIDFKENLTDNLSLNLHDGHGHFKVKFTNPGYDGVYYSLLILEFRDSPRPALVIEFHVEVIDAMLRELCIPRLDSETVSWEKKRKIHRFERPFANEFDEKMGELMLKYKSSKTALCYDGTDNKFNPEKLTSKTYVEQMHNFLYREEKARSDKLASVRPFEIAISKDFMSAKTGISMSREKQLFGIFELPESLSRDNDEGLLILENCSKVYVARKYDPANEPVYEALIEEKFTNHIVLAFSESCVTDWDLVSGRILSAEIQFQLDLERFCRCHYALDLIKDNQHQLQLVCPDVRLKKLKGKTPSDYHVTAANGYALDKDQERVLAFLQSKSSKKTDFPLFIVQGSFGTGKTYTISKCIEYLLQSDDSARVLICTHSNSAASLYIQHNFADVKRWKDKVVRIVYHGRRPNTLSELESNYCLWDGKQFRYPTARDVASHRIFITTFETALVLGTLGTGLIGAFTHIFLDEVAQRMEADAVIPLTLAVETTKVVIAGDHKQITEKIYSSTQSSDSCFTLLERLYKIYSKRIPSHLVVLRNNYRCIPPILDLISLLFYTKNLLVPCAPCKQVMGLFPIQFYDVEGECVMNELSGDYYNAAEASCVADVVHNLLHSFPMDIQQDDIAVVAAYNDQVKIIRSALRTKGYKDVSVQRVQNIQGREFKVVVLSCVHKREAKENKEGEKFGLLSDRNLLNTAFTRTKLAIIAVGNAVTLWSLGKCHLMWQEYIRASFALSGFAPPWRSIEDIKNEAATKNFSFLNPGASEFVPRRKRPRTPQRQIEVAQDDDWDDETSSEDFLDEEEETLPLKDDILDDIVKDLVGINPSRMVMKVDASGQEYPFEQADVDERHNENAKETFYSNFSLNHLYGFLQNEPDEYKRCILCMKNWASAVAEVLDPQSEIRSIHISSKRYLGRTFDKDEVVVHILKKVLEPGEDGEEPKLVASGKVVGILSRYKDPSERKFICVPDRWNSGLMCPIDFKITKFIIGRWDKTDFNIPISRLTKKGKVQVVRYVKYDKYSFSLEETKHFVVRYVTWTENSRYPVGYVSEEIKPMEFERYYTLLHDVPAAIHSPSLEKIAKKLPNKTRRDKPRVDLEHLCVFTIDPAGSTDLDDALSLERCTEHKDCWKIGIHIADVASVVPVDSDVDDEARKRLTTFYSGNEIDKDKRVISPMLPKALSSHACSLLADGQKRMAISIFIHSEQLPYVVSGKKPRQNANIPSPVMSWVRSRRQLTYREAEDYLREVRKNGMSHVTQCDESNLGDQLHIIWQTMMKLRKRRLEWSTFYGQPDFDGLNRFCQEASAHMLIEEAMITCNACCAQYLQMQGCNFLLRVQDSPLSDECRKWKDENVQFIGNSLSLQATLKYALGSDELREVENTPSPPTRIPVFSHVWHQIELALNNNDLDTALILFSSDILQPAVSPGLKSFTSLQSKAEIKPRAEVAERHALGSITHFSLRLPLYSWFSSPIRRYSDLEAQRLVIEKCSTTMNPAGSNVLAISQQRDVNLTDLAKKLFQRFSDAKQYEKDTKSVSFALDLTHNQSYKVASVNEMTDSGAILNLVDLRDLPWKSLRLRFGTLKLSEQSEKSITWRLNYFDVEDTPSSPAYSSSSPLYKDLTRTSVSSSSWRMLVRSIKSSVFESGASGNSDQLSLVKENFKKVLGSRTLTPACRRNPSGRGPCSNDECLKSKTCGDHFDGKTRIGIFHRRKITMPLTLGTPLLVQLHCGVDRGICFPTLQLLSVSQDLDVCIAHNTSPVETFAADVRPNSKNFFRDLMEYADFWLPLVRLEGVYHAVSDNSGCTMLQNVEVTFDATGAVVTGRFQLSGQFCDRRLIDLLVNDFVCIRVKSSGKGSGELESTSYENTSTWVLHAIVTAADPKDGFKKFHFQSCPSLVPDGAQLPTSFTNNQPYRALVELVQLDISHRGIANALRRFFKPDGWIHRDKIIAFLCLNDKHIPLFPAPSGVESVLRSVGRSIITGMRFQLNEGQIEQVCKALTSKVTMIQGPPGTGKSFVGAHLAYFFLQCNRLKKQWPGKIIYCGPSNKSVDVVAEYLLDSNVKVLRVYGKTFEEVDFPNPLKPKSTKKEDEKRPDKKIERITLHKRIRYPQNPHAEAILHFDSLFRNQQQRLEFDDYKSYKRKVAAARFHEFKSHDVIICTCATASLLKNTLRTRDNSGELDKIFRFAQCIIDECGMCNEPETLTPIIACKPDQVVLIGDHMQLQPIIQCRRAREVGLNVSMFERLNEHAGMLKRQYRMDPDICQFPSDHFYDSELVTDATVVVREKARAFRFHYPPNSTNSTLFCHLVGTEGTNFSLDHGGEFSHFNEDEARAAIAILLYLLRNNVRLSDVMILSPYTAQVSKIKSIINTERSHLKDAHVGTVVTSQGSESDYVILSTVRSLPERAIESEANLHWRRKYIGFLTDRHQINVAITRAKSALFIVGNKYLLEKDGETWSHLIKRYESKESLVHFGSRNAPWNQR